MLEYGSWPNDSTIGSTADWGGAVIAIVAVDSWFYLSQSVGASARDDIATPKDPAPFARTHIRTISLGRGALPPSFGRQSCGPAYQHDYRAGQALVCESR